MHLGTAGCKADFLLDFLRYNESDTLYLVGDIIDGWQLKKGWTWRQSHNDVVQKILRRARKGTRVVYVPGNHDEFARDYVDHAFGGIDVVHEAIHVTADGRRLLVTHGDLFDGVIRHAKWLAHLGDSLYTFVLALNHAFNRVRGRLGFGYWSLSQYLKHKVKNAVAFIADFEQALVDEAKRRGFDGVVCGHIHKAELRMIDGILYCNDGDWVESLTALVEDRTGRLEIVAWRPVRDAISERAGRRRRMKILIVTDAWEPQVNGVVRTLKSTRRELERMGHTVDLLTPLEFRTIPCPTYPEIRLSLWPARRVASRIAGARPDAIHIATEGPLGLAARRYAMRHGLPFTTAYHTRFPEYVRARFGVPLAITYRFLRWFHARSAAVLVPTKVVKSDLEAFGFERVVLWSRGVELDIFAPGAAMPHDLTKPIFLYVGRVAVEKNIGAFLALDLPGSKWVAGEGPLLDRLKAEHPAVRFTGVLGQAELASLYNAADVFVFPSRTDTFGLVLLEALACGCPVAAYPVTGPIDVIGDAAAGALDDDLRAAALRALLIPRAVARAHAERYSWAACTQQFVAHLHPIDGRDAARGDRVVAGSAS